MLFGQGLGRVRVLAETPISNGYMSNMVVAKLTTRMIVCEDTPWNVSAATSMLLLFLDAFLLAGRSMKNLLLHLFLWSADHDPHGPFASHSGLMGWGCTARNRTDPSLDGSTDFVRRALGRR
jgi:hypothetical protein